MHTFPTANRTLTSPHLSHVTHLRFKVVDFHTLSSLFVFGQTHLNRFSVITSSYNICVTIHYINVTHLSHASISLWVLSVSDRHPHLAKAQESLRVTNIFPSLILIRKLINYNHNENQMLQPKKKKKRCGLLVQCKSELNIQKDVCNENSSPKGKIFI